MATAGSDKSRARFTAACGVLSRYVKQAAEKAAAAAVETEARSAALIALPLMPGADVSPAQEPGAPARSSASRAQMTIVYGGRVLVIDDVPADKAAGLLQVAAAAAAARGGAQTMAGPRMSAADLPVARKASLRRFMEKRNGRVAARAAPYLRGPDVDGPLSACPDRLELAL